MNNYSIQREYFMFKIHHLPTDPTPESQQHTVKRKCNEQMSERHNNFPYIHLLMHQRNYGFGLNRKFTVAVAATTKSIYVNDE